MNDHIVDFTWCEKCKYHEVKEEDEPCRECLNYPINQDSKKPTKFVKNSSPIMIS